MSLDPATLSRLRRDNPTIGRDNALAQAVSRDCAIAYLWNPYVTSDSFSYTGWSTSLYASVDPSNRVAQIVFRGTDQLIDGLIDFAFVPVPMGSTIMHGGFALTWLCAKRRLLPWLRERAADFDRVVVGGHSLGGALALACAYDVTRAGFALDRCVTVGAPRVYTYWSAKKVDRTLGDRCMRIRREQDVVAMVPPVWLGFRHVGAAWSFVSEELGERLPDPFPRLTKAIDTLWWILLGAQLGDWVERQYGDQMRSQLIVYALIGIAGLGAWAARAMQISLVLLFAFTFLFAAVSLVLVGLRAHASVRYAATKKAANLVEELQVHHLQNLAEGQPLTPASAGQVWVDFTVKLRGTISDDQKQRLTKAVRRLFGGAGLTTALGRSLAQRVRDAATGDQLDTEFNVAALSLLLYGYNSDEIDAMLDTGAINRPASWARFYAPPAEVFSAKYPVDTTTRL